ncbi:MAG: dihydrolipoamide acetyltransferase family protein [Firmicutes bacterium]|nr:dihydrolipoamide acetyltransferase family protein [Bacillota bacterium]
MADVIIMPRQGQSVESCVITEWKKKVGDKVAVGDILFSYETDKSGFEEASTVEGTMLAILHDEGDDVECLLPVCVIGKEGEDISSLLTAGNETAPAAEEKKEVVEAAAPAAEIKPEPTVSEGENGRMKISPRARHLAERTDADLSKAVPTGPNGRIIERDVNALLDKGLTTAGKVSEAPAEAPAAAVAKTEAPAAEYTDVKLPNIRKVIAKSMHASLSNMAQLTLNASFDATKIMAYRASLKEKAEALGLPNITFNDMVLFAVAKTILNHKDLNAHYLDDTQTMRYFTHCNLGMAVDTERGLLVPTIMNADTLSLAEIASAAKKAAKGAQDGSINPDLLKGASFTVSNLGSFGIESFTPVINPPQTGILGVDTITYRVKADGSAYPAMGLSLTFDHRALDGAPAAKFLKELCTNLENFDLLLAK